MSITNEPCSGSDMPEEPENWWGETPDEDKQDDTDPPNTHNGSPPSPPPPPGQDDTDAPESIRIRGYQREGDQWVQSNAKDTIVPSSGGTSEKTLSEYPNYHKQKIASTALFFAAFLIGDWWWDGSNGFSALIHSIESVTHMPGSQLDSYEFWTSQQGFNALDAILITISWSLWNIAPLVFFLGFVLSWRGYEGNLSPEANSIGYGKKSYSFLLYFSGALISMDILNFVVWSGLLGVFDWPFDFLEWRFWQVTAIFAVMGLNPNNDLWERFTSQWPKD